MPFIQQQLIADGVTAEGRVVVPRAILDIITSINLATFAVNAGGTGYAVDDTFELATGTVVALNGANFTAKGRVTSEAAGVVTGVQIFSAGAYSVAPTVTGGATTTLTGVGTGLTVDTTTTAAIYTQDASDYVDLLTNFEWTATSSKASNAPTVGARSRLSASNDSMQLNISSGFDGGSTWLNQPGAPPTNEFYINLPNQDPEIFVSVTERRVNVLVTDDGRNQKQHGGLGLFVPFVDVDSNYPFPGFVYGNSRGVRAFTETYQQSDFSGGNAGVVHPMDLLSGSLGPYQYRNNLSTEWFGLSHDNNVGNDLARAQMWPDQSDDARYQFNHAPVPNGSLATAAAMDPFNSTQSQGSLIESDTQAWFDTATSTFGPQGPAPLGAGSQLHFSVRPQIISNQTNDSQPIGFVDGFEAIHGRGLAAFEEIETSAGRRYIVFNDTDSTALYRWTAMEII